MNGKETAKKRRQSKKINEDNRMTSDFTTVVKQYVKCFDCGHLEYGEEGNFISESYCTKCNSENISSNKTLTNVQNSKKDDRNFKRILNKAQEYKDFVSNQKYVNLCRE